MYFKLQCSCGPVGYLLSASGPGVLESLSPKTSHGGYGIRSLVHVLSGSVCPGLTLSVLVGTTVGDWAVRGRAGRGLQAGGSSYAEIAVRGQITEHGVGTTVWSSAPDAGLALAASTWQQFCSLVLIVCTEREEKTLYFQVHLGRGSLGFRALMRRGSWESARTQ